jgi:hypothetical protein
MKPAPIAYCGLCGNRIQWAMTALGKKMPLDMGAHDEGNVTLIDGIAIVLGKDDARRTDGSVILLMPHFATCTKRKRADEQKQS